MITYILAFLAAAGWACYLVAEAAYADLRVERDHYRGLVELDGAGR